MSEPTTSRVFHVTVTYDPDHRDTGLAWRADVQGHPITAEATIAEDALYSIGSELMYEVEKRHDPDRTG